MIEPETLETNQTTQSRTSAHVHTNDNQLCAAYVPHPDQQRFHDACKRFKILCAGRRAGKTIAAAAELLVRVFGNFRPGGREYSVPIFVRRPRALYWVVSATYDLLKEPIRYVMDLLPRSTLKLIGENRIAGWRAQEHRLWLPGDVEIAFRSAEDPLSLVGVSLDGIWIDEAARVKPAAWEYLRPALTDRQGWFVASTTPLSRNWVYDELWRRGLDGDPLRDPQYACFTWPTSANPYLSADELVQARRDLPDATYRREYEASWDAFVGQIYPNVTGETFELLKYREVVAGIDWGYAAPGALVVAGLRADGVTDVIDEDYASGRAIPQWLAAFKAARAKYGIRRFFADPSAPMLIREARQCGLVVVEADNDVWEGIQTVQTLVHGKLLRIHLRCRNLLNEMAGYRWNVEKRGTGLREEPAPAQDDHLCDSLRYLCRETSRPPAFRAL